jgi:hypothetical protein
MNPKKNVSKWKTRPSLCATTARYLALPLIALAVIGLGMPIAHAAIAGKGAQTDAKASSSTGSAALASFGAFGALIGTDRGSRKFFEADKGATGGERRAFEAQAARTARRGGSARVYVPSNGGHP